ALIMAYGWGYRGTVGHEAGAMVPGALLGLVLALASGRSDWERRTLVAGLFSAIGFAWGGSLSYMEQTFYVSSDSFPDVLYGFTILFFLGGMWAGIGGAGIGFALTESRSTLEQIIRPFTAVCGVFFIVYIYFFLNPEVKEAYETFTVRNFHDGDWLPATLTLMTASIYWLVRPKDREGASLFFWGAVAWWIGYLSLTKFGGLRLGPLHRSESWGGVLGVLVVVLIYLVRRKNRAALMMSLYGILAGGFGFVMAVFIRHPIMVDWGPFADWPAMPDWRIAEVSFGFFMGLGLSLGALRLIRDGVAPPEEDVPRAPLDVYAGFVILVALVWINFRRHVARLIPPIQPGESGLVLGLPLWGWYGIVGMLMTAPVLYCLYLYFRGNRMLVPRSAFGKGALATLLLLWVTQLGYGLQLESNSRSIMGLLILLVPASISTLLIVRASQGMAHPKPVTSELANAHDIRWRVGIRHGMTWLITPVFLLAITGITMAMQETPFSASRKRFGPEAYWRQTSRMMGTWRAVALSNDFSIPKDFNGEMPVAALEFSPYRDVTLKNADGEILSDDHRWFLKNQYTWLGWHSKSDAPSIKAEVPLHFEEGRIFITWPPDSGDQGYLVLEKAGDE
ncbi:MAG: hypothetical protein KC978_11845, partial [Candidatus Omnitrophica bacterium]|nr:hypothetical protein [Candidatus Omnitrophota bacterium]